jgi:hypothetical protein
MGGLLDTLSHIEDLLLCADPGDDVTDVIGAAVTAASDLWATLLAARGDTPRLSSPGGLRLALLIPLALQAVDHRP